MHLRKHLKHDERQEEHGKQTHKPGDVTVSEFKNTQSPKIPLRVIHVHPYESSVAKHVQGMDGWDDKKERSDTLFPRHVQYGDGADKEHHGLDGGTRKDEVDANHPAIGEKKFGLERVFARKISRKPAVPVPIFPTYAS